MLHVLQTIQLGRGTNTKAARGVDTMLPAAREDKATKRKTSPEQPWSSAAGVTYRERVWKDLRCFFQQDELTDVMLVADGQSIPCHKVLLAASSRFFYDKFVVNQESLEHNLLDIEHVDFDTLRTVVSFVYDGHIELTVENAEKLVPASINLMLPELTNMCKEFLQHTIDRDRSACIAIHRIGKANSLTDIRDRARQTMLRHFLDVSQMDAFMEMSENELQEYIGDTGLNVTSEDPVFEAVMTWVENRKSSLENLIENVNLSHCSQQFLGKVRKEPLMQIRKCLRYLTDALYHHMTTKTHHFGGTGRKANCDKLLALYADQCWILRDGEVEWICEISSFRIGAPRVPTAQYSSACMMGDSILITGGNLGKEHDKCSKKSWTLTIPTMRWTALPDLNIARSDHATVCVGNQVYVLGGWDGQTQKSVEYLDEQNELWCVVCDMPVGLFRHIAVSYKHFIFVFGGFASRKTFMFNSKNKKWSRKANMPSCCEKGSSVVYGDRIYVLGGEEICSGRHTPNLG